MKPPQNNWSTNASLLAIMMAWGLNISAVKMLTSVLDEIWVGTLRMLVASAALTAFVLLRDRRLPRIDGRQWAALTLGGLLMVYANQLLFSWGMHLSTATGAALIMALSPAVTVAVSAMLFRERLSRLRLAGLALGFAGVVLVVLQRSGAGVAAAGFGELVVLLALLTFVLGGAIVQRLARELDALAIGWAIYSSGTVMLIAHAMLTHGGRVLPAQELSSWTWTVILYSGLLGTALSNVGWYRAIARIGMGRASLFFYWMPVFGTGFAVAFLGEALSAWHLAGLALVLLGTRLGTARER